MRSAKLRVGIVGAGGIARGAHIGAWKRIEQVEVLAVADIIPERARKMAREHGIPHALNDHRKLLDIEEIDAVDVCTPNRAHTPIVLNSLAAGKHVLCEKPLAVTPKEIVSMIKAAKRARRTLAAIQNQRFRAISQAIKRWIDAGRLGTPYYARAWAIRRNLCPPSIGFISKRRSGGGPCMDIGVHCLDLAMWLMDFPKPISVTGAASNKLAKSHIIPGAWGEWDRKKFDVEDFACGMVRFKGGAMLSIESSWLGHTPEPENLNCMILGDKAGISWPSGIVATTSNGALVDSVIQPPAAREEGHNAEIRAFFDAVAHRKPSPVPAEQVLEVIKILDGIYRSQKLGREVRFS